jgi:hypothetical protein
MNPLTIGKRYILQLPDSRTVGRVRIVKMQDDWAEGPFEAEEAFAELRPLFEEEAELRNDQIIPLWEQAADRIESLRIQVVGEDGQAHPHLRIFIEGDEAFLSLPLKPFEMRS